MKKITPLALILLCFYTNDVGAQQPKPELYFITSAYNTFYKEEDQASLMLWSKRVIPKYHNNYEIIRMLSNISILFKNRTQLKNTFKQLWIVNNCPLETKKSVCTHLNKLWNKEYSNIKFDNQSNSKIIDLRNSIKTKQCKKALGLISQIQKTESEFKDFLQQKINYVQNCSIKLDKIEVNASKESLKRFLSISD